MTLSTLTLKMHRALHFQLKGMVSFELRTQLSRVLQEQTWAFLALTC